MPIIDDESESTGRNRASRDVQIPGSKLLPLAKSSPTEVTESVIVSFFCWSWTRGHRPRRRPDSVKLQPSLQSTSTLSLCRPHPEPLLYFTLLYTLPSSALVCSAR